LKLWFYRLYSKRNLKIIRNAKTTPHRKIGLIFICFRRFAQQRRAKTARQDEGFFYREALCPLRALPNVHKRPAQPGKQTARKTLPAQDFLVIISQRAWIIPGSPNISVRRMLSQK